MPDIHDIPKVLSVERLEAVIAGDVEVLRGLSEDEFVDIIFFAASTIEESPDAMKLLQAAKRILILQDVVFQSLITRRRTQ